MTNAEYIKNLSKDELAAFLKRVHQCGGVEHCNSDCPWREAYKKFGIGFSCPPMNIYYWLGAEVKPAEKIFEVN